MAITHTALAIPYRQPYSIWDNNAKTSIQEGKGELILSPLTADYITKIRDFAKSHGFEPGTPIIDLSCLALGTIYALNSYTPKNAWITSGSNERTEYFRYALSAIPCEEIIKTWVLLDDGSAIFPIQPELLSESGLDIEKDYVLVGRVAYPKLFRPNRYTISYHYFFIPVKNPDDALADCRKARGIG
jgi:hypothetical protein